MRVSFLNKKHNKKIIVFFNGWGMDYRAITHIPNSDFDIVMLNEFFDLHLDLSQLLKYDEIYVVAWSLGVWVANFWLIESGIKPTKTIAINGTLKPIDASFGIAPEAFQGTIDNWNESNRMKFQLRMFKDRKLFSSNLNKLPIRSINEQKQVLEILQSKIIENNVLDYSWDKVFIGSDDLIFLTENQIIFWNNKASVIKLPMPHFPFLTLNTWEKIIE